MNSFFFDSLKTVYRWGQQIDVLWVITQYIFDKAQENMS